MDMQIHNIESVNVLLHYLVHWLPNNANHLYENSKQCLCRCVDRRQFNINVLFYTSQINGGHHYVCVDVL
jgi:hypothetical protein